MLNTFNVEENIILIILCSLPILNLLVKKYLKAEKKLTKVQLAVITEANVVEKFALYSSVAKNEAVEPL